MAVCEVYNTNPTINECVDFVKKYKLPICMSIQRQNGKIDINIKILTAVEYLSVLVEIIKSVVKI
jgi:hypothetical protein